MIPRLNSFSIDSRCREHWLVPQQFSVSMWPAIGEFPALVDCIYSGGHSNNQLSPFIDSKYCDSEGVITPLEQAARSGHANVLSCLLINQGTSEMKVTERVW
jgi:hypothetical protein